jgi:DUF4097 and DUF4098 domain-containing protein YvlB
VSEHVQRQFPSERPVTLKVEIGSGRVQVAATDTTTTTVEVTGRDADQVTIEQSGDTIAVIAPRSRVLSIDRRYDVRVSLPTDSTLAVKVGSAELTVTGRIGDCSLKSGSGDIRLEEVSGDASVLVGSGDVTITGRAGRLQVKSGSGNVQVASADDAHVITGSGNVWIGETGAATDIKTGSGNLRLDSARGEIAVIAASGDLTVGRIGSGEVRAKSASGDVRIGIPQGTPVWTDISTISGDARAELESAGPAEEGQDHVVVRASTVSGRVLLHHA